MRKSKRQAQGKCVFCGGGNLSKEHFWPEWASPLLPSYPVNQHVEHTITTVNKGTVISSGKREKPGHAWTKKVRVVCETCNNGWMSRLETAAKPFLTPLITGTPCTVTASAAQAISRWIAMKVMVAEHNLKGDAVSTEEQRGSLRATLAIPGSFRIWVGRCGVDGWQTAYWRHCATVSLSPDIMPEHKFKNLHSVTFGIGQLLVFVLHTTVKGLDLEVGLSGNGMMVPLWPPNVPFTWPPARTLTSIEATFVAHGLDRMFRGENVIWKPMPD